MSRETMIAVGILAASAVLGYFLTRRATKEAIAEVLPDVAAVQIGAPPPAEVAGEWTPTDYSGSLTMSALNQGVGLAAKIL